METLYTLPVPSTALLYSPKFSMGSGRNCAIEFSYEGENDPVKIATIRFTGIEAFKCTYYRGVNSELIGCAYDKIVSLNDTDWLSEIADRLNSYNEKPFDLQHLAIYFDDGPAFEFICRRFEVFERTKSE